MSKLHRRSVTAIAIAGIAFAAGAPAQTLDQVQQALTNKFNDDSQNVQQAPQAAAIGDVVATVCPQGQGNFGLVTLGADLQARCNELAGSTDSVATGDALLEWAPEEAATQGSVSVDVGSAQLKNVGARLAVLRGAAGGMNVAGLYFNGADGWNGGALGGAAGEDSGFSRLGFFVNGDFQTGDKDATALESGFDYDGYGVTAGMDYRLTDTSVVGVALGFTRTDADLDAAGGKLDTDGYSVSVYGSFYPTDATYVDVSVVRGWNDFDQQRNISYNAGTAVNQVALASPDGDYWTGSVGAGYLVSRQAWSYGPYARLEATSADVDGFTETLSNPGSAGNGLALNINDQSFNSTTLSLGGSVSYAMSTSWGVLVPSANLAYVHEFSNDDDSITGTFVNDPTATAFNLAVDDGDSNYFRLGVGASAQFAQGTSGFIYYQTLLGYDDLTSHTISAGLRFEF